jgi:translation initiation factor 2-alpha kinase 4
MVSFLLQIPKGCMKHSFQLFCQMVVYGFIDLFSGYGESWNWSFGIDETAVKSSSLPSSKLDASKPRIEAREKKSDSKENPSILQELPAKLDTVGEVSEESNNCLSLTRSSRSLMDDSVGDDNEGEKEVM